MQPSIKIIILRISHLLDNKSYYFHFNPSVAMDAQEFSLHLCPTCGKQFDTKAKLKKHTRPIQFKQFKKT